MKDLIVIKIGGSVITDKTKEEPTLRLSNIKNLTKQIVKLYGQGYKIILVHGAGSFGHPLVKKYSLHKGMYTDEQKQAFSTTLMQLKKLNQVIIESLQKHSVPAIGLHPHNLVIQKSAQIRKFQTVQIKKLTEQNIVTVLHGDGVIDLDQGCSILSGDTIAPYLANKLKASLVIFLTDVDGVYDSDPKKNPHAKLIPEITNENLEQVLQGLTKNNPYDVTGEMKGKILSIKQTLTGIPVLVGNGLKNQELQSLRVINLHGSKLLFH